MPNTGYYVTAIRGQRVAWLAGPFADHGCATIFVDRYRSIACEIDPWCDFDAFGTSARTSDQPLPIGILWQVGRY